MACNPGKVNIAVKPLNIPNTNRPKALVVPLELYWV